MEQPQIPSISRLSSQTLSQIVVALATQRLGQWIRAAGTSLGWPRSLLRGADKFDGRVHPAVGVAVAIAGGLSGHSIMIGAHSELRGACCRLGCAGLLRSGVCGLSAELAEGGNGRGSPKNGKYLVVVDAVLCMSAVDLYARGVGDGSLLRDLLRCKPTYGPVLVMRARCVGGCGPVGPCVLQKLPSCTACPRAC